MYLLPHQVSLFVDIKDPELVTLIDQLSFRKVPKGFPVFQQGETGSEIYAILNGEVEIVGLDTQGDYVTVATLKPGSTFGEFSYFTGQPRTFTALATTDCAIIEISPHWLSSMAKRFPSLAEQLGTLFRNRILTNVLRSTRLFSSLSPYELEELGKTMELRTYPDGAEILREGDKGNELYAIKLGRVAITKRKQGKKVSLKEIGPGEILGEMAAITGEPRSASAHASGSVEALVLSGERFQALLQTHPKILASIEDVIRHRSDENRQALEAVVTEVFEGGWEELEDARGIRIDKLNMHCRIDTTSGEARGHIVELSSRKWAITPLDGKSNLQPEASVRVQISTGSAKFLQELSKRGPFDARVETADDGTIALHFGSEEKTSLIEILKTAAQAKLRGLIFPRYDAKDPSIGSRIKIGESSEQICALKSMSLTHAAIDTTAPCTVGQLLTLRITQGDETLVVTKAVVLGVENTDVELQLEYETASERAALENIIRVLSGGIGPARMGSSDEKKAEPTPRTTKTVLVKKFESAKDFIRTYMASIDAGVLRVAAAPGLSVGMQVQVQLLIPGFPGVRKAVCFGRIQSQAKGSAVVELADSGQELQNRLRALFEKLLAAHAEESWEQRKHELTATLARSLWDDPIFRRIVISSLVAANIAVYGFTYLKLALPQVR